MIKGDVTGLLLEKEKTTPQRQIGLWEKLCFELFIKNKNSPTYIEFNFGTQKDWNAFLFHKLRGPLEELKTNLAPICSLSIQKKSFSFSSKIPLNLFPNRFFQVNNMLLGPSVILKDHQEKTFHYGTHHPHNKLDFHRYDCFTLEI